jgi:hypothetical protein
MRIKNTRPTLIYWLVDTRTNTPFYCGKTVATPEKRLRNHLADRNRYDRPISLRLRECGDHVQIRVLEIVPIIGDWVAREKRWIELLRFSFPDCVNVASGGQGPAGFVPSVETRVKLSNARKGQPHSPQHRANLAATLIGRPCSVETREKMRTKRLRDGISPEHRANIAAANRRRAGIPRKRIGCVNV